MRLDLSKSKKRKEIYLWFFCSRPDTQRFLEKLKRQQEAKLHSQEADNRPFILKYVSKSLFLDEMFILLSFE